MKAIFEALRFHSWFYSRQALTDLRSRQPCPGASSSWSWSAMKIMQHQSLRKTRMGHLQASFQSTVRITLELPYIAYPILSYPILSYPIQSYPIQSFPILSFPILSYPILSYLNLSYSILYYLILSYPILYYPMIIHCMQFWFWRVAPALHFCLCIQIFHAVI